MKTYIFNGKFMSDKHNEKSVFIAMEGDNNSGVVSFELDRYSPDRKGVDLGGYAWQLEVKGYILPEPHENVIGELTGLSKEVRGSTISVRWTVGGENTFLSGEGEAQLKAIGANGEVWKSEPFTVVVGQSINADGVAELYPGILTELSARALALEGRMDTAESDIETLQGNVDALGSDKQDKYDETLTTTDKTVVGAINEVKNASDIAKQTADGAKNTAEAIDGKATEALSTAEEALGIAEGAEGAVADKASLAQVDGKIEEHDEDEGAHGGVLTDIADKYVKPETGIPKTDLADGVQSALDKADSAIQADEKGSAGGVVPLDANGHIPEQYMPGSYDEIRYYDNYASFPSTGTADIIYVARDTNLQYRWGGESYVPMGSHLALGETENTAYRGDRGKAAYDARHSHSNKATLDNIPTPVEGDEHKVLTVNEMADGYELAEASGGTEILVDGEPVESFNANAQYYQESVHMYVGGGEDGGTQIDVDDEALKLTHNDSGTSLVVEDGAVKAITNVDEPFMAAEDEDVVTKKFFEDNAPTIPTVPAISTDIAADATSDTKTASPQAVKAYVDSTVSTVYRPKGSVANYAALLAVTGMQVGDVYNVIDTEMNYAWDGTTWDALGATVDLSNYYNKTESDNKFLPKTDPVANRYRTTSGSFTDFPKAEIIGSAGDTGHTFGGEIGVVGEANADASTYGVGVGGVGKSNGAQHGIGVFGRAKVGATGNTGDARGGAFLSIEPHTGGDNMAVYASAQGGANNYSFYGHSGVLYNEGAMKCNTAPVEANDVVRKTELEAVSSPITSVSIYGDW